MTSAIDPAIGLATIDSPAWFIENILGTGLYSKTRELAEGVLTHRRVVVKACHASGKTHTAAGMVIWNQVAWAPEAITATTAPTFAQVENLLWEEIRTAYDRARIPLGGRMLQTPRWDIGNKHFAYGFTTEKNKAESAHGLHAKRVFIVIDEASGVEMSTTDALAGSMVSENVCIVFLGNPTRTDTQFKKEFDKPETLKITISAFDTPNFTTFGITLEDVIADTWKAKVTGPLPAPYLITPQWVADAYRDWGVASPLFRAKVLAEFPEGGDHDTLIPLRLIEQAQARTALEPGKPVVLGMDVARFGDDRTEFYLRRGPVVRHQKSMAHSDTMATTGEAVRLWRETGATKIQVDGVGVGGGVVDRLKELRAPVYDMQAGGKPTGDSHRTRFANLRAEWFWNLRTRFVDGTISLDPTDQILASQLCAIKYRMDSAGRILIESKEDMKKRGLPSPDRADALMLAFAETEDPTAYFRGLTKL